MGELLRRHWHPVAGAAEFSPLTVKAVRILGEDLALFRDKSGNYGLVDQHCPHRRADLTYGFVEERGLLPDWDRYRSRGYKQIAISLIPCNWLQCQENSIDHAAGQRVDHVLGGL